MYIIVIITTIIGIITTIIGSVNGAPPFIPLPSLTTPEWLHRRCVKPPKARPKACKVTWQGDQPSWRLAPHVWPIPKWQMNNQIRSYKYSLIGVLIVYVNKSSLNDCTYIILYISHLTLSLSLFKPDWQRISQRNNNVQLLLSLCAGQPSHPRNIKSWLRGNGGQNLRSTWNSIKFPDVPSCDGALRTKKNIPSGYLT